MSGRTEKGRALAGRPAALATSCVSAPSEGVRSMLDAALGCRALLEQAAVARIAGYVRSQQAADGGFRGRGAQSDLYYTVFGIEALTALGAAVPVESLRAYLDAFGAGAGLDLVHAACLARCSARLAADRPEGWRKAVAGRIEECRSSDGGYGLRPESGASSLYAGFLAWLAYEDLDLPFPDRARLLASVYGARVGEGGYADSGAAPQGTTPTTAAAAVLVPPLGGTPSDDTADWLLARFDPTTGGFRATPDAPVPDLLSTATALFALSSNGVSVAHLRSTCTEFVELLWAESGGFCGSLLDTAPDCEYTFYALLALGCLA
ncbi:MAG: hypothetical protein JXR37_18675 [Kiritimatiellae bacterium]|nr:hypothetical protein [Kiritimatiellia bacterium]